MSRQELIAFWISTLTSLADHDFNAALEDLSRLSKDEIMDILDEM